MQDTTQPNIPRRPIFVSIDATDDLVQCVAHTYSKVGGVQEDAAESLDHFASRLPPFLRRPLARTSSAFGLTLVSATDGICMAAWSIYRRAQTTHGTKLHLAPSHDRTWRKPPSQANRTCNKLPAAALERQHAVPTQRGLPSLCYRLTSEPGAGLPARPSPVNPHLPPSPPTHQTLPKNRPPATPFPARTHPFGMYAPPDPTRKALHMASAPQNAPCKPFQAVVNLLTHLNPVYGPLRAVNDLFHRSPGVV